MPGEHIDKIYNEAIAKITYKAMTTEQREKATELQKQEDSRMLKSDIGGEVFRDVENSGLSASEKQEIHQRLAKASIAHELQLNKSPGTLLRGNSKTTQFMADYLKTYAPEYIQAVNDATLKELAKINLPPAFKGKELPPLGREGDIEGVTKEDLDKLQAARLQMAKIMITAAESNLHLLPPDVREFAKQSLQPTTETHVKDMNITAANLMVLRGVMPGVTELANQLKRDPELNQEGNLLLSGSQLAQKYVNTVSVPVGQKIEAGAAYDAVHELRTEESIAQTTKAFKSLSEGGDSIDKFVEGLGEQPEIELTEGQSEKFKNMQETGERIKQADLERIAGDERRVEYRKQQTADKVLVQPELDKLAQLQSRLEKLSRDTPPLGERFKAFFTKGGIETMKAQVSDQIEKTKLEITKKVDGEQFDARMDLNKDALAKLDQEQNKLRPGAETYLNLKQQYEQRHGQYAYEVASHGYQSTPKAEQLFEEASMLRDQMEHHESDYQQFKNLGKRMGRQEEVVSHGEKLGQNGKSVRDMVGDLDKSQRTSQSHTNTVK